MRRSPSGSRCRRASGSPATLCSVSPPLPMSCRSAATISTSGRETERISSEASMQVSTTCRSTVNRWIDRGVRQQPDPLPLRQDPGQRPGLLERLPDRRAGPRPDASSRTSSCRASVGQGSGSGAASRARRAAVGGASTASRSAAAAAARSSSTGSSAGRAPRSSTTSPRDSATPGASGSRAGLRAVRGDAGRASTASTRRQASRDRWVIRRPSSRTCTCAARSSSRSEADRRAPPKPRGRSGRWPGRRPRAAGRARRAAPAGTAPGRCAGRRPARWPPAP